MSKNIRGLRICWTQNLLKARKTMLITSYFRSSGSVFTKEASFIRLLENSLNSSRAFVQKPALVLVIPAVHIFCVAMAVCVNLIRKLTGGVSFEVNRILISSLSHFIIISFIYLQKLDKFIAEVHQLKSKHQSYSVIKRINKKIEEQTNSQKAVEKSLSCCRVEERTEEHQEVFTSKRLLRVAAFVSISLVYIQFFFLLILISLTQIRAGFIFLLICTFYLSYLVLKVSLTLSVAQIQILSEIFIRDNESNMKNYALTFTRTNVLNFPKRELLLQLKYSKVTTTCWIITI